MEKQIMSFLRHLTVIAPFFVGLTASQQLSNSISLKKSLKEDK
jgi:hypothetical protein